MAYRRRSVGRWASGVERRIFSELAIVPYLRRIRARYGENVANDVPAGLAFVESVRFG